MTPQSQEDGSVTAGFPALQQAQKDRSVTARSPVLQQAQENSTVTGRSPALQQIRPQQQPADTDISLANDDRNVTTAPNVTRILSDLMKMYSQADSAKKYSGERYDHL